MYADECMLDCLSKPMTSRIQNDKLPNLHISQFKLVNVDSSPPACSKFSKPKTTAVAVMVCGLGCS